MRERPLGGPIGTRHIYRPGTVELRSIRRFQKSAEQLIPEAAFRRLLCESQAFAPLDISEDEKEVARLLLLSNMPRKYKGDAHTSYDKPQKADRTLINILQYNVNNM